MYHDKPRYYLRIWSLRFGMFVNACEFLCATTLSLNDAIAFWEKKHPEKRIRIDLSPKYSGDEYEILYQSEIPKTLKFYDGNNMLMQQTYDTRKPYSLSCWLWIADRQCHILSPIKDDGPKGKAVTLQQIVDHYDAIHPEQQYVINYNCVQIYSSFIPPTPTPTPTNKEEPKGNTEIQLSLF